MLLSDAARENQGYSHRAQATGNKQNNRLGPHCIFIKDILIAEHESNSPNYRFLQNPASKI